MFAGGVARMTSSVSLLAPRAPTIRPRHYRIVLVYSTGMEETDTSRRETKTINDEAEHTSSRTIKRRLLTTNGHLRPYRSEAIPKATAPTERNMRTRVMPHVMSVFVLPNCSARFSTVSETVKKSNASQVCPRRSC